MDLIDDLWRDLDRRARMGAGPLDIALDPSAWVVTTYRLARAGAPVGALHRLLERATNIELPLSAEVGGGFYVTGDARVGPDVRIGRDCNLAHGASVEGGAYVGDRAYVGAGARIEGPVRVGNDAAIGRGAHVTSDVPDRGAAGGERSSSVVPGRRRPSLSSSVRGVMRGLLPKPAQLLLRAG